MQYVQRSAVSRGFTDSTVENTFTARSALVHFPVTQSPTLQFLRGVPVFPGPVQASTSQPVGFLLYCGSVILCLACELSYHPVLVTC